MDDGRYDWGESQSQWGACTVLTGIRKIRPASGKADFTALLRSFEGLEAEALSAAEDTTLGLLWSTLRTPGPTDGGGLGLNTPLARLGRLLMDYGSSDVAGFSVSDANTLVHLANRTKFR